MADLASLRPLSGSRSAVTLHHIVDAGACETCRGRITMLYARVVHVEA
jgi:hypothetical protein